MIPKILFQEIKKKRCFLFVGAGFSTNAQVANGEKMPTWSELAKSLCIDLHEKKENPLEIASMYEKENGRTLLIKKMTELLHVGKSNPGRVHKKLTTISEFDTIVTTNFEHLLENAYFSQGKHVNVIVGDKNISKYSPSTEPNIIKIHGDFSNYPEIVITQKDYDDFLTNHPVLAVNLAAWFTTKTPLFIGYSLTDPHFIEIRKMLKNMLGEFLNPAFIVKFDATQKEIEDGRKDSLIIINLETKGREKEETLAEFLCEIQDYVNAKNIDTLESSSKEEQESKPKIQKIGKDDLRGKVLASFANLEVKLRDTLLKYGYEQKDTRSPFSSLIKNALNAGILTMNDIGELTKLGKIRNDVAHTSFSPTLKEMEYVEKLISNVIHKLETVKGIHITPIQIELFTDKNVYSDDESIFIRGKVNKLLSGVPISLRIVNPNNNLVVVAQLDVSDNREFEISITAGGVLWEQSGKYSITALYGRENNQTTKIIDYIKTEVELLQKVNFTIDDKVYPISYMITGGYVNAFSAALGTNILTIGVDTFTDGKLQIKIPRLVLDAKSGNQDAKFLVLCDGEEIDISEKTNDLDRDLTINFVRGTNEIMIVGTTFIGTKISKQDSKTVEILQGSSAPREDEKYLKPQLLIIKKGETVTWDNCDTAAHVIMSGTPEGGPDGEFDSKLFMADGKYSHKFEKKGTYRYFCAVHPWKEGKIIVTD